MDKRDGELVALKIMPMETESGSLEREVAILKKCNSPFIVNFRGSFRKGKDIWVCFFFCCFVVLLFLCCFVVLLFCLLLFIYFFFENQSHFVCLCLLVGHGILRGRLYPRFGESNRGMLNRRTMPGCVKVRYA